jgi:hypothetical protein
VVGLVALYGHEAVGAAWWRISPAEPSAPPPGDMGAVYSPYTQDALPFDLVDPPA